MNAMPKIWPTLSMKPVIWAQPIGNIVSLPQSIVSGCSGIKTMPWQTTRPMYIQQYFSGSSERNFKASGKPTVVKTPTKLHTQNAFRYFSVFSTQIPKIAADTIPVIMRAAPKLETQSGEKPQGCKISSINEPQILKVPLTVPKAKANIMNFLFFSIIVMDFLNSMFWTIEDRLGKVGGLSLKNIMMRSVLIAAIMTYTMRRMKKWSRAAYFVSSSDTKKGGIRKPTAVPMMLTTVNIAMARDL